MPAPVKNVDRIRALMAEGSWRAAVLLVAKFPRIPPKIRERILKAREAYQRPDFQVSLGRNIDQLIDDGKAALVEEYGAPASTTSA